MIPISVLGLPEEGKTNRGRDSEEGGRQRKEGGRQRKEVGTHPKFVIFRDALCLFCLIVTKEKNANCAFFYFFLFDACTPSSVSVPEHYKFQRCQYIIFFVQWG